MQTDIQLETVVPEELQGCRLDQAAAKLWPDYSRSRLTAWIKIGELTVNEKAVKPKVIVEDGDILRLNTQLKPVSNNQPQAITLSIIYEDEHLLIVNKPAGLVVHPGAGNPSGTLVNGLLAHAPELEALPRAGLVHRLDKDTSGLLVVAKTLPAHTALTAAMQERLIGREYNALVWGVPISGGIIDQPIARHHTDRTRYTVKEGGRDSVTHFRVLEKYRKHSLLKLNLETGRTHQIRVHMLHKGYPLLGDPVYKRRYAIPHDATDDLKQQISRIHRQALHAQRLTLTHPVSGEEMSWECPWPDDFANLVAAFQQDTAAHK